MGVKNNLFFQIDLEKRVCGLILYSLLFLYHIDPYLSPEPFYSFNTRSKVSTVLKLKFMKISHLVGGCVYLFLYNYMLLTYIEFMKKKLKT